MPIAGFMRLLSFYSAMAISHQCLNLGLIECLLMRRSFFFWILHPRWKYAFCFHTDPHRPCFLHKGGFQILVSSRCSGRLKFSLSFLVCPRRRSFLLVRSQLFCRFPKVGTSPSTIPPPPTISPSFFRPGKGKFLHFTSRPAFLLVPHSPATLWDQLRVLRSFPRFLLPQDPFFPLTPLFFVSP